jgi:hypothetical protein
MRGLSFVILCLAVSGCGSLKIRDVNSAELSGVKKAAVASFSFYQPHSRKVGLNLGTGRLEADTERDLLSHQDEEVTQTYNDMVKALASRMKWSVTALDDLRQNQSYQKAYDSKMKGWQNKAPPHNKHYVVKNIMDSQSLRRMRQKERDNLMNELAVDAMLEMQVDVNFANSGVKVMGIGSRHPQSTVSFCLYKRGVEKPVWFEGRVLGDVATESVGKTAFFDEDQVTRLGRLSARSAFNKLNPHQ